MRKDPHRWSTRPDPDKYFPPDLMHITTCALWDLLIQAYEKGLQEQVHDLIGELTLNCTALTVGAQRQSQMFFHWADWHDKHQMRFALALASCVPLQSQSEVLEKLNTLDFPEGPQEMALVLDIAAEIFKSRQPNAPRRTTRRNPEPEGRRGLAPS
jgi:hypothetical protein